MSSFAINLSFARDIFSGSSWSVAWTVFINGYVGNGNARLAIDLFFEMWEKERRVGEFLGVALFNVCAQLEDLSLGRRFEDSVRQSGTAFDLYMNNALIDMYCKCGSIVDAQRHFDFMVEKDVVAWNSMITGYGRLGNMEAVKSVSDQMPKRDEVSWSALFNVFVQNGRHKEALAVCCEMEENQLVPNDTIITGAIAACAQLDALDKGTEIHRSLNHVKLFESMFKKNRISYNVMICRLASHGRAGDCLDLFSQMLKAGIEPDGKTFVSLPFCPMAFVGGLVSWPR
ncbi:Pentatricopeptide repeat [Dillenia turbinata]|uniref:Pentatricopeptide repeat n=1 Tax=Dillenia turbinata TaxID=194707 RepID=A0AAN8Z185_9MAGN